MYKNMEKLHKSLKNDGDREIKTTNNNKKILLKNYE